MGNIPLNTFSDYLARCPSYKVIRTVLQFFLEEFIEVINLHLMSFLIFAKLHSRCPEDPTFLPNTQYKPCQFYHPIFLADSLYHEGVFQILPFYNISFS